MQPMLPGNRLHWMLLMQPSLLAPFLERCRGKRSVKLTLKSRQINYSRREWESPAMADEQILRRVKVEGGYLRFSSAHFITFGGKCERLHNHHLQLIESPDAWEIHFQTKRYVFPRTDVVELPIDNSSAERLAEYICSELYRMLAAEYDSANLDTLMVGVEEAPTQMAYYRRPLRNETS